MEEKKHNTALSARLFWSVLLFLSKGLLPPLTKVSTPSFPLLLGRGKTEKQGGENYVHAALDNEGN